jgi:phosphatidylethanolamine/phosphatidyl-N-methylethanolamine N-methyltransferase
MRDESRQTARRGNARAFADDSNAQGHRQAAFAPVAGAGRYVRECATFLRGFIEHPGEVGSIIPSSRMLEARIIRNAALAGARCVVELGPGSGGTTRALLRKLSPNARLLAIELNSDFSEKLRAGQHDPRFAIENESAERIGELLAKHKLPAPDAIVSGIPFSTMPPDVGDRIAKEIGKVLAPGGRFVAYQITDYVVRYSRQYLGEPRIDWEMLNIPPIRTFTFTKPR